MKILHLSAECYPAAKAGGLADVVGSLPKYLVEEGIDAPVVIPKYGTEWIENHRFKTVFEGTAPLGDDAFEFRIQREAKNLLGFPFYVVDIPKYFSGAEIYPGNFASERFTCFQIAVLEWLNYTAERPDIIHCHDHHTGLTPFMLTQSFRYDGMKHIPTVFTVHNAEYQGIFNLNKSELLPDFNQQKIGLLDWDQKLNCLAAGLKSCWKITTVSPSYMQELSQESSGLEWLFQNEQQKSKGILNGIDEQVWNPATDDFITRNYSHDDVAKGKAKNKKTLCKQFGLNPGYPTISYIGRLAREKGADLLPDLFQALLESPEKVNFIVLGTGDPELHQRFREMSDQYVGFFDAALDYNEPLAHQVYAGSDFMVMPSRVEPCGLNQMYAMRYGSVPIVRNTGGLKDTVKDISRGEGSGIKFNDFTLESAV
ncbi:MAG TPA: glycogen/starch synthase, partial [Balneolaceae bacterium]|nr:glycogen/starch synthase [Balneolaceae bacterium]